MVSSIYEYVCLCQLVYPRFRMCNVCASFGNEQQGNTLNFGQLPLVVYKNLSFLHSLFKYYIHTQLLTVNIGKMADGSRV